MVFSVLSAVVLGLAASTMAYPRNDVQTAYQLAQMEELQYETEVFLDTYPRDRMIAMQRAVSSATTPLLAACEDVFLIFTRGLVFLGEYLDSKLIPLVAHSNRASQPIWAW